MSTFTYEDSNMRITVEITDIHLVVTVFGLAAAVLTLAYLVTRDHDILRRVAEIARSKNVVLTEHGRKVLS